MKSTCVLILASLVVCNLAVCGGQGLPDEDETDRMTIDDIILQRAESLLLRSILKKLQNEDGRGGTENMFWMNCTGKRGMIDVVQIRITSLLKMFAFQFKTVTKLDFALPGY